MGPPPGVLPGREGYLQLSAEHERRLISSRPIGELYDVEEEPFARGKYAAVRRCRPRGLPPAAASAGGGWQYAAKFLRKRRGGVYGVGGGTDLRADILHEVAILHACQRSTRVVSLHGVFESDAEMILLLELAAGGELQALLDEDIVPEERQVKELMRQILLGLRDLHAINVAHLDLKPQNVVLTGEFPRCEVKLCDLGISRYVGNGADIRDMMGTPDYVAPEVLNFEPISLATDMWSAGVLMYVLLTGCSPFGGDTKQETFCNISRCALDFPEELFEDVTEHAKDLMRSLMIKEPSKRLTVDQSLEHSWFSSPPAPSLVVPSSNLKAGDGVGNPMGGLGERSVLAAAKAKSDRPSPTPMRKPGKEMPLDSPPPSALAPAPLPSPSQAPSRSMSLPSPSPSPDTKDKGMTSHRRSNFKRNMGSILERVTSCEDLGSLLGPPVPATPAPSLLTSEPKDVAAPKGISRSISENSKLGASLSVANVTVPNNHRVAITAKSHDTTANCNDRRQSEGTSNISPHKDTLQNGRASYLNDIRKGANISSRLTEFGSKSSNSTSSSHINEITSRSSNTNNIFLNDVLSRSASSSIHTDGNTTRRTASSSVMHISTCRSGSSSSLVASSRLSVRLQEAPTAKSPPPQRLTRASAAQTVHFGSVREFRRMYEASSEPSRAEKAPPSPTTAPPPLPLSLPPDPTTWQSHAASSNKTAASSAFLAQPKPSDSLSRVSGKTEDHSTSADKKGEESTRPPPRETHTTTFSTAVTVPTSLAETPTPSSSVPTPLQKQTNTFSTAVAVPTSLRTSSSPSVSASVASQTSTFCTTVSTSVPSIPAAIQNHKTTFSTTVTIPTSHSRSTSTPQPSAFTKAQAPSTSAAVAAPEPRDCVYAFRKCFIVEEGEAEGEALASASAADAGAESEASSGYYDNSSCCSSSDSVSDVSDAGVGDAAADRCSTASTDSLDSGYNKERRPRASVGKPGQLRPVTRLGVPRSAPVPPPPPPPPLPLPAAPVSPSAAPERRQCALSVKRDPVGGRVLLQEVRAGRSSKFGQLHIESVQSRIRKFQT